jgi:DNA polymerase I-like protein with 3'-5' exonuclease and polymerase domains
VDGDALLGFGEVGALLIRQNDLVKEEGFVEQALTLSAHTGCLHGNTRLPGTLTGRIAANTPNYSQFPKSRPFLSCMQARPGYKLVELDFSAIEQVVLTELSKDPALWKIYGPSAAANDIYLFSGSYLPVIGEPIRAAGYDPDHPTKEGIAAAKKLAKRERGIAKTVVLASSYGAGSAKIAQTLRLQGIDIGDAEAAAIHRGYWDLYAGVKAYQRRLEKEHRDRGGWVLNGVGRPIGVSFDYAKDLVNRVCQSTAHDCLMLYTGIYSWMLDEVGIEWYPWLLDYHDETVIEVREDQAAAAAAILEGAALRGLNKLLGGVIPVRGSAVIADNLADIKCED